MKKTTKTTKTTKQTDEATAAINELKQAIFAAILAHGANERVIAMSKDMRKICYTEEEIAKIKAEADKTNVEVWEKFYGTFRKLGYEI